MFKVLFIGFFLMSIYGCGTIKPYEKEFLLSPIMDDTTVGKLDLRLHAAAYGEYEKVAVGGSGSAAGTSCPTCGG